MELIAIDYRGVEVDKCSACEGIWLDAGELEQIAGMEKSSLDKWFLVFRR
jgi:Zn-finger nucleic acid-binding protein